MVTFAALACLFGWSNYIAAAFGLGSDPGNNPLGPLLAALVVVTCQGRAELSGYWKRLRSWRASPGWYALALLVPLAVHLVIVAINHGFGAPLPTAGQLSHWPELPVIFVVNLVFIGIGEEAGWTAFAAPLLLHRHGLLRAWAILAALRILWHLPLMLTGQSGWVMGIVGNAAFQMILLQLFYLSGGRWSLAAVWHASLNTFGGSFFTAMVIGADQVRYGLLLSASYTLLAIFAASGHGRKFVGVSGAQARTSLRSPRSRCDSASLSRRPGDARTWTPESLDELPAATTSLGGHRGRAQQSKITSAAMFSSGPDDAATARAGAGDKIEPRPAGPVPHR